MDSGIEVTIGQLCVATLHGFDMNVVGPWDNAQRREHWQMLAPARFVGTVVEVHQYDDGQWLRMENDGLELWFPAEQLDSLQPV